MADAWGGTEFSYERTPLRRVTGDALRPGGLGLTRRALALCDFPIGARLLDIGCGPGASLALFHESGFQALGIDHSLFLLDEVRSRQAPLRGIAADFHCLPLRDESMDGIFAECVLSLASDKASVLAECRRTLKTEGRLVISDIILRGGEDGPARTGLAEVPCVKGASPLSELLSLLRRYGFSTLHVEDHGNLLGELAAALVFEFGSLDAFLELWNDDSRRRAGHGCALPDISPEKENRFPFTPAVSDACGRRGKACPPGANLGYTLIIAVKFGDRA